MPEAIEIVGLQFGSMAEHKRSDAVFLDSAEREAQSGADPSLSIGLD
jgi:hypothetical protein